MAVLLDLACKPPRAHVHTMERPLPDGALIGEQHWRKCSLTNSAGHVRGWQRQGVVSGNQLLRCHLLLTSMHNDIRQKFEQWTVVTRVLKAYAFTRQLAAFAMCNQLRACVSCRSELIV